MALRPHVTAGVPFSGVTYISLSIPEKKNPLEGLVIRPLVEQQRTDGEGSLGVDAAKTGCRVWTY